MSDSKILQPEVIVFAGPNGSGKLTITRMAKTVGLIPQLVDICDILHIYDNTNTPFRIFKKRKIYISGGKISIGIMRI